MALLILPVSSIAERLREAREIASLTQDQLAERAPFSKRTLVRYEKGETEPGAKMVSEVARITGVSYEWLRGGEGQMFDGDVPADTPGKLATSGDTFASPEDDPDAVVAVPQYGHVGAGDGRVPPRRVGTLRVTLAEYAHDFAEPPRRISTDLGDRYAPGDRFGYFIIDGDSAAPVFFDRERVPVQLLEPERTFANDLLYVFRWQGEYQIKRLRLRPDGTVRASSLNPSIDPFEFKVADEEDFAVVALARVSQKQQLYTALVGRLFDAISL